MSIHKIFIFILFFLCFSFACYGQSGGKNVTTQGRVVAQPIKSSAAYAEILLQKTERLAELEDLLVEYTEEFPKVKQIRVELVFFTKEMNRILSVNPAEAAKLSAALGKLVLRKIELEMEYVNLLKKYSEDHPDVKQAKRKVEIFEAAIQEILP